MLTLQRELKEGRQLAQRASVAALFYNGVKAGCCLLEGVSQTARVKPFVDLTGFSSTVDKRQEEVIAHLRVISARYDLTQVLTPEISLAIVLGQCALETAGKNREKKSAAGAGTGARSGN